MTRTEARQMSGPVPSPSMKGMIGWSGTVSLPFWMVIFCPCRGTFSLTGVDIDELRGVAGLTRVRGVFGGRILAQRLADRRLERQRRGDAAAGVFQANGPA